MWKEAHFLQPPRRDGAKSDRPACGRSFVAPASLARLTVSSEATDETRAMPVRPCTCSRQRRLEPQCPLQEAIAQRIKERSDQAAARLRAARAMLFRQLQERLPGTVIDDAFLQRTAHLPPDAVAAAAQGGLSPAAAAAVAADVAASTRSPFEAAGRLSPSQRRSALLHNLLSSYQVCSPQPIRKHAPILRSCPAAECTRDCTRYRTHLAPATCVNPCCGLFFFLTSTEVKM